MSRFFFFAFRSLARLLALLSSLHFFLFAFEKTNFVSRLYYSSIHRLIPGLQDGLRLERAPLAGGQRPGKEKNDIIVFYKLSTAEKRKKEKATCDVVAVAARREKNQDDDDDNSGGKSCGPRFVRFSSTRRSFAVFDRESIFNFFLLRRERDKCVIF